MSDLWGNRVRFAKIIKQLVV